MSFLRISRAPGRAGLRFVLALFALAVVVLIVYREEVVGPAVVPLRILTARMKHLEVQNRMNMMKSLQS